MSVSARIVTILCSVQVFFIVVGYLITRVSIRVLERLWGGPPPVAGLLHFVQTFGPWCLLLPLVWGVLAIGFARVENADASITKLMFVIGMVLTVVLVLFFSIAAISSLCTCFSHYGPHRLS
jgi:uncharacterized membrane protein YtjA (UPF0391 family)